jgi:AcrR family transcriptional regulator
LARQDRAERTRNAILDAAAEVFDQRGFSGASLSDILAKAGVTKGALYFHFTSKEELARAVIEEQYGGDLPELNREDRGLQTLIDLTHAFGRNLLENVRVRASNRLVAEAHFSDPAPDVYQRWIDILRELLEVAQAHGDLRKEWDPDDIAQWLAGGYMGIQTMAAVLTGRSDLRERITIMWEIALPGLVPARRLSRFNPSGTIQWDTSAA